MVPVVPKDKILVKIDRKFYDETSTGLVIDTSWRPGHYATVTGTVVSVPHATSAHPQKKVIPMEVRPGDKIAFSYTTVFKTQNLDNAGDIFYEDPVGSPFVTKWSNGNGKSLIRRNRKGGKFDAALFTVENGKSHIVDKMAGTLAEANNLIDKYLVEANNFIRYQNCLPLEDGDLWAVDYQEAFAVLRGHELIMIGGHVLLEHPGGKLDRGEYEGALEIWGEGQRKVKRDVRAKVVAIGTPLIGKKQVSISPGETAIVDVMTAQEYNFWGKEYLLVRQPQILAKVA